MVKTIKISLTTKEVDLLLKWYHEGWTDYDIDGPLFKKLKAIKEKYGAHKKGHSSKAS
jgi:hypothetical protein